MRPRISRAFGEPLCDRTKSASRFCLGVLLPAFHFERLAVVDPAALWKPAVQFVERSNRRIALAQFSLGPGFPIERLVGLRTIQFGEGIVFFNGFFVMTFVQSLLAFVVKLLLAVELLLLPIALFLFSVALFLLSIALFLFLVFGRLTREWS